MVNLNVLDGTGSSSFLQAETSRKKAKLAKMDVLLSFIVIRNLGLKKLGIISYPKFREAPPQKV